MANFANYSTDRLHETANKGVRPKSQKFCERNKWMPPNQISTGLPLIRWSKWIFPGNSYFRAFSWVHDGDRGELRGELRGGRRPAHPRALTSIPWVTLYDGG